MNSARIPVRNVMPAPESPFSPTDNNPQIILPARVPDRIEQRNIGNRRNREPPLSENPLSRPLSRAGRTQQTSSRATSLLEHRSSKHIQPARISMTNDQFERLVRELQKARIQGCAGHRASSQPTNSPTAPFSSPAPCATFSECGVATCQARGQCGSHVNETTNSYHQVVSQDDNTHHSVPQTMNRQPLPQFCPLCHSVIRCSNYVARPVEVAFHPSMATMPNVEQYGSEKHRVSLLLEGTPAVHNTCTPSLLTRIKRRFH